MPLLGFVEEEGRRRCRTPGNAERRLRRAAAGSHDTPESPRRRPLHSCERGQYGSCKRPRIWGRKFWLPLGIQGGRTVMASKALPIYGPAGLNVNIRGGQPHFHDLNVFLVYEYARDLETEQ